VKARAELIIDEVIVHERAAGGVDAFRDALTVALRTLLVEHAAALPGGDLGFDVVSIFAPPDMAPESLATRVAQALVDRLAKGGEP
jgi:hypothetical protein